MQPHTDSKIEKLSIWMVDSQCKNILEPHSAIIGHGTSNQKGSLIFLQLLFRSNLISESVLQHEIHELCIWVVDGLM